MYSKDGQTHTAGQIRAAHPHISFAPGTYAELGYVAEVPKAIGPKKAANIARRQAIAEKEAAITARRLREAILGKPGAVEWIAGKEAEIEAVRVTIETEEP